LAESAYIHERQQWQQWVDRLTYEKEELVRSHTLETAELRKKNAFLTEDLQRRASIPMSAVPSSTGYSSAFSDFDHLSVDEHLPWNEFSLMNAAEIHPEVHKRESALAVRPKEEKSAIKEGNKTAASGLLLMLLLCGAWVASSNSTTTAVIPEMPEDVRIASAAVLDNLYKDAGLQSITNPGPVAGHTALPQQGQSQHQMQPSHHPALEQYGSLHPSLTLPSHQEQRDQAFSLSATQYNHITNDDDCFHYQDEAPPAPNPKRNLREALTSLRVNKEGLAAEVYTRSLMWDEVPTSVVRDFARMISESEHGRSLHTNGEPIS